jgi:hypothetical protein
MIDDPDLVGAQRRATIEEVIPTDTRTSDNKEQLFRFCAKVGGKTFEHLMTYNKMIEWRERDQQAEGIYRIEAITGHRKTKNGTYEVQMSWSTGENTWEPMRVIFQDDPISVSIYAKENGLLNTDGWKSCKRYVSNAK